jgi:hypothetical protein
MCVAPIRQINHAGDSYARLLCCVIGGRAALRPGKLLGNRGAALPMRGPRERNSSASSRRNSMDRAVSALASGKRLVCEIGTDMRRWPTAQHFTSWLTLAPKNKVSGAAFSAPARSSRRWS